MASLEEAVRFGLRELVAKLGRRTSTSTVVDDSPESAASPGFDPKRISTEYKRLRAQSLHLTTRLAERAIKSGAFDDSARKLGMLRGKSLVMQSEHDMDVIVDHAIYCHRVDGLNLVERCHRDSPPTNSDERRWLDGMVKSYFSVFMIVELVRGTGIWVVDLVSSEPLFVADVNSSLTAETGMALAARILPMDDWWATTGNLLPISGEETLLEIQKYVKRRIGKLTDVRTLASDAAVEFQTFVNRTCLAAPYAEDFVVRNPGDVGQETRSTESSERAGKWSRKNKIGRNEPCPCGSAEKYKRCCGRGIS